jgi:DNA-binding response OmpR family regulator
MNIKTNYTLLYVEDDAFIQEMVIDYLEDYFSTIHVASNGEDALKMYVKYAPSIIITDIKMPKMNGLELSAKIRETNPNIPILITTAYTTTEYLLQAVELHLIKYLIKPIEEENLKKALESCFQVLEKKNPSVVYLTHDYSFDIFSSVLTHENKIIPLTSMQIEFLNLLITHKDRTVLYEEIEYTIWEEKNMSSSALRCLVRDIRKAIHKDIVKNISKRGYKINLND